VNTGMSDLIETLRDAQRFGFFGDRPIEEAVEHSMSFVRAIGTVPPDTRIIDLGSGGGLPGLVIGSEFPEASILLVDRRRKRTDFLERAVARLRWAHVKVLAADVHDIIREVDTGGRPPFDIATARGFGPPEVTLRSGTALVRSGGSVIISEPPVPDRWPAQLLHELGVRRVDHGSVSVFCDV